MIRILVFEFLSSKCPDLYHTCCYIGLLGEVVSDAASERYRERINFNGECSSTPGSLSTGPHGENGTGILPLTKCEELLNQIMDMYDEWHVDHPNPVTTIPWDFMKDPIIKSRYEKLVDESSIPEEFEATLVNGHVSGNLDHATSFQRRDEKPCAGISWRRRRAKDHQKSRHP